MVTSPSILGLTRDHTSKWLPLSRRESPPVLARRCRNPRHAGTVVPRTEVIRQHWPIRFRWPPPRHHHSIEWVFVASGVVPGTEFMSERTPMQPEHDASPSAALSPGCDAIEQASAHVRQMLEAGAPRHEMLTRLATAGEVLSGPGATVSILFLDEDGLLRNGASPNLPSDYLDAIDRLKPSAASAPARPPRRPEWWCSPRTSSPTTSGRSSGTCRARWASSAPGACRSSRPTAPVLGTFGTYFRNRRTPTVEEQKGVERLAAAAALVLARR